MPGKFLEVKVKQREKVDQGNAAIVAIHENGM